MREAEGRPLNSEIARNIAITLAKQEELLAESLKKRFADRVNPLDTNSFFSQTYNFNGIADENDGHTYFLVNPDTGYFKINCFRESIGSGFLSFGHIIDEYRTLSKVETDYSLHIELNDENPIRRQDEEALIKFGASCYYFNRDGEYGKVSLLFRYPTKKRGESGITAFASEMTAGDFELAAGALDLLLKRFSLQSKTIPQ